MYVEAVFSSTNRIRKVPIGLTSIDHCLEVLRSSVICNPDLSPYEIFWTDHQKMTIMARAPAQRQCVDFDAIQDFARSRAYHRGDIVD